LVEIVIEVIGAGTERGQVDRDRLLGFNHLFPVQLEALELDGFLTGVDDPEDERVTSGNRQRLWREAMVLKPELRPAVLTLRRSSENDEGDGEKAKDQECSWTGGHALSPK